MSERQSNTAALLAEIRQQLVDQKAATAGLVAHMTEVRDMVIQQRVVLCESTTLMQDAVALLTKLTTMEAGDDDSVLAAINELLHAVSRLAVAVGEMKSALAC